MRWRLASVRSSVDGAGFLAFVFAIAGTFPLAASSLQTATLSCTCSALVNYSSRGWGTHTVEICTDILGM